METVASENEADVKEYLIVICNKTIPKSLETIKELQLKYGDKMVILEQKLPFLGGAIRDAFDACKGTHTIMMSSDLETDPAMAKELIRLSKESPDKIITTTRWVKGGGFTGYNPVKLVLNWIFQKMFSILYHTNLTDMTFGYRIFPTALVQSIRWEEVRHPFLLETVLKPLKLGVKVVEIPIKWEARLEGESQNPFFRNFVYFRIGFKVLFYSKKKILL